MKNRMNVPEVYEPVLPDKVKALIEKVEAEAEAEAQEQVIYYQCVDDPNCWSFGGHRSSKQPGCLSVDVVLMASDNEGALMVTFEDNRLFKIQDGTMLPCERR